MHDRHHGSIIVAAVGALLVLLAACSGSTSRRDVATIDDIDRTEDVDENDTAASAGDAAVNDEREALTSELFARFDSESPGCAVAVRHDGDQEFTAGFGAADLDAATAITDDTIFDIGSVSKQMTAGAVALLAVDGRLDLDDDVTDLVVEIGPYDDTITVGDLIHHTSGLPDYIELLEVGDDEVTTMDDALRAIASPAGKPVVAPGTQFEYSNTNYVLLAIIVERISGQSLADFTAAEIFEPLGMDASVVRDDQGTLLDGQAQGYANDGGWVEVGSSWRQTGDGAVHSTAADLLLWADLFLDGPTVNGLGSQEWLNVMLAPGAVNDDDGDYGGGIELVDGPDGPLLRHGGSWIGYGSALTIEPAAGLAVAVTCNIDGVDAEGLADQTRLSWR